MRRILILRGGALGDFIVTLPALALLRRRWPEAQIELIGNATAAQLAIERGLLDAAHSQHEKRWSAMFADTPLPPELEQWLARFDLVLNYWPDPDGSIRGRFTRREDQTFLSASAQPAIAPAAAHYCSPLKELGLSPSELTVSLGRPAVHATHIAVHPGSGSSRKTWPAERWAQICRWLRDHVRADVLVVIGAAEQPAVERVLRDALRDVPGIEFAVEPSLSVLSRRLEACRLFLGHDSGISHLAAAVGVPCVLLFGPTDPAMWAPPARHVRVIRGGNDLGTIAIKAVEAEIQDFIRHSNRQGLNAQTEPA